jgi:hypothetical protein
MEPQSSLPYSQVPATCPYPESAPSSPHNTLPLPEDPSWGTRCSNIWLVFLIHPNNINVIHTGRAKFSVSVRCLVLAKMYGNRPTKLFVWIMRNRDVRMNEFPLFSFHFLRTVFISRCSLFISKLTTILFSEGICQILVGIGSGPTAVLVQFNGRLLISVIGSKI